MKNFKSIKCLVMAIVAVVCVTLTACGGDDDSENVVKTSTGVHRIDVSFSGDTSGWDCQALFVGTHGNTHDVKLYENGKDVTETPGGFAGQGFRDYSVETDASCDMFVVTVTSLRNSASAGTFTITLKGYVNSKQTNMKVYEFKPDKQVKSCVFYSEDLGADLLQ